MSNTESPTNPGRPEPGDVPQPGNFPPGEEPNPERKEPEPREQPGRPSPSGVPNEIRANATMEYREMHCGTRFGE